MEGTGVYLSIALLLSVQMKSIGRMGGEVHFLLMNESPCLYGNEFADLLLARVKNLKSLGL